MKDSNNKNTDKRAGRPPQASLCSAVLLPYPQPTELQIPGKALLLEISQAESWSLVWQREKVLPFTPFKRLGTLKVRGEVLPRSKLPEKKEKTSCQETGEQNRRAH